MRRNFRFIFDEKEGLREKAVLGRVAESLETLDFTGADERSRTAGLLITNKLLGSHFIGISAIFFQMRRV